jgi:hypothetical protein
LKKNHHYQSGKCFINSIIFLISTLCPPLQWMKLMIMAMKFKKPSIGYFVEK